MNGTCRASAKLTDEQYKSFKDGNLYVNVTAQPTRAARSDSAEAVTIH